VIRQSIKERNTPHPLIKDIILWHIGSNVISFNCFQEFQPKRRKSSERKKNHMPGTVQEIFDIPVR